MSEKILEGGRKEVGEVGAGAQRTWGSLSIWALGPRPCPALGVPLSTGAREPQVGAKRTSFFLPRSVTQISNESIGALDLGDDGWGGGGRRAS